MEQNTQMNVAEQQQDASKRLATILFENEKGAVEYEVAGAKVKLSYSIVRNYLTKGNTNVPDADIVQFIQICRFNQLNPFIGEAYLVKYGDTPAQMITSKEALMKRAEANENYEGYEAGIIVKRGSEVVELEGTFMLNDDILLGGWANVYRKDRRPVHAKVSVKEFSKGQSTWKTMPATMIRKVAMVQALREAFPAQLGAMYTVEESNAVNVRTEDAEYEDVTERVQHEIAENANGAEIRLQSDENDSKRTDAPETAETPADGEKTAQKPKKAPF